MVPHLHFTHPALVLNRSCSLISNNRGTLSALIPHLLFLISIPISSFKSFNNSPSLIEGPGTLQRLRQHGQGQGHRSLGSIEQPDVGRGRGRRPGHGYGQCVVGRSSGRWHGWTWQGWQGQGSHWTWQGQGHGRQWAWQGQGRCQSRARARTRSSASERGPRTWRIPQQDDQHH